VTAEAIATELAEIRALCDRRTGRGFPLSALRDRIVVLAREAKAHGDPQTAALAAELEAAARMVREETY
jgi:hypothetical protein